MKNFQLFLQHAQDPEQRRGTTLNPFDKLRIDTEQSRSINSQFKSGYIALSAVLIISFVVLAITTSVTFLSIGEAQSSLALLKGEQTLQFVEECAEEALWKTRASASYTGGVLTLPEGSCSVAISKAGNQWTIDVSNTGSSYTRTIRIVIYRTEVMITLISWKEI